MTTAELLDFMRSQRLAIQASVGPGDTVQAALVGFAVTDSLEIVFDTLDSARKIANLRRVPSIAFVIGGCVEGDERTVQYEGIADEPAGDDLERIQAEYFAAWPDGMKRASRPGLVYVRVKPTWIRYTDFNCSPPAIVEFTQQELRTRPADRR